MEGLRVGSDVLYVLDSGRCKGDIRPAKVVRIFEAGYHYGMVNMQVFTDGMNDDFPAIVAGMQSNGEAVSLHMTTNTIWRTSVHYDESKEPGTWHWPEKA
jgi:hypothetical protein